MGEFFDQYNKIFPKKGEPINPNVTGMSFNDMKAYFDAMSEKLQNDMRKEMSDIINASAKEKKPEENKETNVEKEEKEGTEDASNSSV